MADSEGSQPGPAPVGNIQQVQGVAWTPNPQGVTWKAPIRGHFHQPLIYTATISRIAKSTALSVHHCSEIKVLDEESGLIAVNYDPFFGDYMVETVSFRKMKAMVRLPNGKRLQRALWIQHPLLVVHIDRDLVYALPREVYDMYKYWLGKLLLSE